MEPSSEVAVQSAPVVTKNESSFSESSHENKVEHVANGTIESSVNKENSASQSTQSSIQVSADQTIQQSR